MTHGPGPGADEFARIRMARHRTYRRRFTLVAVVLVLVGAVTAGVLVTYGLSGDPEPERDADGRLVPPGGLELDDAEARDLVASGTWPGEARVEGMPTGDADRIGWLVSEVAWESSQASALGPALREAAEDDADLARAAVDGAAGAARPLLPDFRDDVAGVLGDRSEAVGAALADEPAPEGQPSFDQRAVLALVATVGREPLHLLEQSLVLDMGTSWQDAFPDPSRREPGAARRFSDRFAEEFRRSAQPVVLLYAALAAPMCGEGVDEECRAEVTSWTARADRTFAGVVFDSIPRELLPRAVDRALGDDAAGSRDVPPAAQRVWERFRQQQGYGITGPVLDALAG